MKKNLFVIAALFLAFSFTSCSKDEVEEEINCSAKIAELTKLAEDEDNLNCESMGEILNLVEELKGCQEFEDAITEEGFTYETYHSTIKATKELICSLEDLAN
ncbi:hypothetical protein [Persicobacter psychrovividus]|uniref:Lipoprotein n=1 Tax=Persicobacter psychrovividus TaxID=387638 RepID=A0ABM7VCW0_9BACT|nr:hypothetical protein PEPS_10530 [Persicobacter psychrovividus]